MKAITPREAKAKKTEAIPDVVIEAFNELILAYFDGDSATIEQDEVVKLIVKKGISKNNIFERHYLDIEPIFEAAGWKVEYDKPGFNETYEATFTFKKKRSK